MKSFVQKIAYPLTALLIAAGLLFSYLVGGAGLTAYAADLDITEAYERTNVLDDLKGSTLGGNTFHLADYTFNENGKPQIISFVEFGYSFYSEKQDDYGLYVYVYNPQGSEFDISSNRNKIQLTYGSSAGYGKYPLRFLNYSTQAGYEGLFYKFKINLTAAEKNRILSGVSQNSRIYKVSGIELSVNNIVTEYAVAQTYTYSGYSLGYGSSLATESTLSCNVDGFDKYLELEVTHTFYRPQGDYYNGEQSQLNSCYFRVPNAYFTEYGELTKILCEWYEYFTKPILVTEDSFVYNRINALHGADTDNLSDDMYFLLNVFWENAESTWFHKKGISDWTSNYGYEVGDSYRWGFLWGNGMEIKYDSFSNFAAAFYTGGTPCEDYEIDGNALKQKLLTNSGYLSGELLSDRFSEYLFEDYVQNGYDRGYNRKEINADDFADVFWHVTTKSFWQRAFGGFDVDTIYDSKQAIEKISESDLSGTDSEIAGNLYINENDVSALKAECAKASKNDETVVLLRYSTTQYMCAPCVAGYCSKSAIDGGKTLVQNNAELWNKGDFNAYVAQETVYLDFDIISLWFTADGVSTEIPVVTSPSDVIAEISPPLEENYHDDGWALLEKMLSAILIILLVVVLVVVLWPLIGGFFSPIFGAIGKGIVWIITAPFKLIGKLFHKEE